MKKLIFARLTFTIIILLILSLLFLISHIYAVEITFNTSVNSGGGSNTIQDGGVTVNYGTDDNIKIGARSTGAIYRGLIKFNTSSISTEATVNSCILRLRVRSTDSSPIARDVTVYRILQDWGAGLGNGDQTQTNESDWIDFRENCGGACANGGNWNEPAFADASDEGTEDGTYDRYATPEDNLSVTEIGIYNFTVNNACQNWVNGSWRWDYGLAILAEEDVNGQRKSISTNYHATEPPPFLVIDYTVGDPDPVLDTQNPEINGSINDTVSFFSYDLNASFNVSDNVNLTNGTIIINLSGQIFYNFSLAGANDKFSQNITIL